VDYLLETYKQQPYYPDHTVIPVTGLFASIMDTSVCMDTSV